MSRRLSASLLAAVVALSPIPLIATTAPAAAQVSVSVGFNYFYDQLSPYGDWYHHPRWGDVWRPARVPSDFRPYYRGRWMNTEFGWTWNSEYPWGDIAFHYGRWVYDPYDGWLWVPGYVWAPAWVVWREGGGYVGWFPMPPDPDFLAGVEVYRTTWNWDRGYFGYADWYGPSFAVGLSASWVFVDLGHFATRDYYRYAPPRARVVNIINTTTNVTNYVTVNNRIVNRSINVAQVERAAGRRIERVNARQVVRAPITTVDTGRRVQVRERERHGGDVRAPARERARELSRAEVKVPVRERRADRIEREQQPQQPQAQKRGGRGQQAETPRQREERAQTPQRERGAARTQAEQRQRDERTAVERQQKRSTAERAQRDRQLQQQRQRDERTAVERQQKRSTAERSQRDRQLQQQRQRDERAAVERQQEQQRARAEQAEIQRQQRAQAQQREAEKPRAARAGQQQRAEQGRQAARQQQAQEQRQAAAEQRQRRARAQQAKSKQQDQEEQRQGRERQRN